MSISTSLSRSKLVRAKGTKFEYALEYFDLVLWSLRECIGRLHLGYKCDPRLGVSVSQPQAERYLLTGKHGGDALKANVTLLGDNVIQAEVAIRHPKASGGMFRAIAQPDVQWKLQQLQDLGNHITRASKLLFEADRRLFELSQSEQFTLESGELVLSAAKAARTEISAARNAIVLPRRKSLLELSQFPPTRRFNPALPQDQLLSFYISSCRLVCASYHMTPKQSALQGLSMTITIAECHLPYLEEVLQQLDLAMTQFEKLIGNMEMCQPR
ncbi:unnamed protein product [Angiostrongylus costaricensis]|uniref:Mediator of RNA polymerase II transcription subunit 1 n=1 Tax=Angiostrongylus costaricensis TaxID=334426 RepID=A0A0R3PPB9_ANGCS|nr:unnamed protein product [Angiostrongylus costaricensis]